MFESTNLRRVVACAAFAVAVAGGSFFGSSLAPLLGLDWRLWRLCRQRGQLGRHTRRPRRPGPAATGPRHRPRAAVPAGRLSAAHTVAPTIGTVTTTLEACTTTFVPARAAGRTLGTGRRAATRGAAPMGGTSTAMGLTVGPSTIPSARRTSGRSSDALHGADRRNPRRSHHGSSATKSRVAVVCTGCRRWDERRWVSLNCKFGLDGPGVRSNTYNHNLARARICSWRARLWNRHRASGSSIAWADRLDFELGVVAAHRGLQLRAPSRSRRYRGGVTAEPSSGSQQRAGDACDSRCADVRFRAWDGRPHVRPKCSSDRGLGHHDTGWLVRYRTPAWLGFWSSAWPYGD